MKSRSLAVTALLLGGLLGSAGPAGADAVTDWNAIAQQAIVAGRPGPPGALDSALVQAAVHDAVQAIEKRFEPYHVEIEGATGAPEAAAVAAAHGVLVGLYPAQAATLDATYFDYLAQHGLSGDAGLDVGHAVAARMLPLARRTPDPPPPPFVGANEIGVWRPTDSFLPGPPPPFSPMAAPWAATLDPFTLTAPTRFRAPPPPALTSAVYARDYNEVKSLGSLTGATRTPAQTDLAYFYTDNFLAQWNRAIRAIADQHVRGVGDSARLFALVNLSMADAFITAWDSKVHYAFWRPVTAIREGDSDGNPATAGDPAWQSLVNNPNYPDYTSGANNVSAAAVQTLALYFHRDRMTFEVTSNAPLAVQKTRVYRYFSAAMQDVVDARVYLGIHFRFADTAARTQGKRVAEWVFDHFLLPVDNRDHRQGAQQ